MNAKWDILPVLGLMCLLLVSACSTASLPTATPRPTLTLIPATPTPTPTTIPPTATVPTRTDPELLPVSPVATSSVRIPAGVQTLVRRAITQLMTDLDVTEDMITLTEVQAATWSGMNLGCGDSTVLPGITITVTGYRLSFEVDDNVYVFHTDDSDELVLCDLNDNEQGVTRSLVSVDPVAEEFVALARRRVSTQLEVDAEVIDLVSVRSYQWTDNSLGCPLPGNTYEPATIDGYRIELEVGDQTFIFHTSFDELVACDSAREVLPE